MTEYNEYVNTVRGRLKKYRMFRATVASLTADIEDQERILAKAMDLGAPIAMYDNMPKGGSSELTTVERQTEERLRVQRGIQRAILTRDETQFIIDQLDRALGTLSQEEEDLLRGHYIDGKDWQVLGYEQHYTERWARKKAGKALKTMAFIIFGPKSCPEQLSLAFVGR